MNHDIKNSYFKLLVEENVTNVGGEIKKFITLNLKEIVTKEQFTKKKEIEHEEPQVLKVEEKEETEKVKKKKETSKVIQDIPEKEKVLKKENTDLQKINQSEDKSEMNFDDYEKCLSLVELQDLNIKDKVFKKGIFCNMNDELVELIIHDDILKEVSTWEIGSTIVPVDILEKGNFKTLKTYKDLGIIKKQKV